MTELDNIILLLFKIELYEQCDAVYFLTVIYFFFYLNCAVEET